MKLPRVRAKPLLLFLGTSLLPIYPFGSGGIQPAHAVLALFAGLTLLTYRVPLTLWSLALFGMFLHSFIVESIYLTLGSEPGVLLNSLFNLYNFVLVAGIYTYVRKHGLRALVPGILIAGAIAVATIVVAGVDLREMGETGRATGTFNNPNQLGYFSVCLLSLTYLFYRHGHVNYWLAAGIFAASGFLAISSLSKAAMIANFIVIFLALKPAMSRAAMLSWFVVSLGAGWGLFLLYNNGAFDEFLFMRRISNIASEGDSSLESRGYFALLEGNALQLLFGLGAQGVQDLVGHEVHSTFGSVANNYGLFGLAVFFLAFAVWALRLCRGYGFIGMICLTGPAMMYGITHNGTRFTIFWVLFAASLAMAQNTWAPSAKSRLSSSGYRNESGTP